MTDVPCNGCSACCYHGRVLLTEEEAASGRYRMIPNRKGNDGPLQWMLANRKDGGCYYLMPFAGGEGCSVHDDLPSACKDFDCRRWWRSFNVAEQDLIMRDGRDRQVALEAQARL
jgi:Fe-S-cluster containining protein